jgi:hypothetical protein
MNFAPTAFRETRIATTKAVEEALRLTSNLRDIAPEVLQDNPSVLPVLRMATCPPIARDRLIGLTGMSANVVKAMEKDNRVPPRMNAAELRSNLQKIGYIIEKMADPDIFVWLCNNGEESQENVRRAATIVADRLTGAEADPIIRNAQEQRQLAAIEKWLKAKGYRPLAKGEADSFVNMPDGTFSFRLNVPVTLETGRRVNIPVDAVIMRRNAKASDFPMLVEAKSAGDFRNVNKRRKEEAVKMAQLRNTYGKNIEFNLFLCGYFDCGYLGYEAAEGIDWVWEHRIDDFSKFAI